jgi:dipeptidyl aminopeptidase/acylaminoacyl peptidase
MLDCRRLGVVAIVCAVNAYVAQAENAPTENAVAAIKSKVFALADEQTSVLIAAKQSDTYNNIYLLDHATQRMTLRLDAGKNISQLLSNYTKSKFYVLIDNMGDENFEIFEYETTANSLRKIFGNAGFKATIVGFSKNDKTVFVRSNHLDKSIFSIFSVNLENLQSTLMTNGKESFDGAIVSPSEKHVFLVKSVSNNETRLYKLDRATQSARLVLAEKGTVFWPTFFGHNEKYLYAKTNWDHDRKFCGRVLVAAPTIVEPVRMSDSKDVECEYDRYANVTILTESFEGRTDLKVFDDIFEREWPIQIPEKAQISAVSSVGKSKSIIFKVSKSNDPGEFYFANLKEKKKPTRITQIGGPNSSADNNAFSYDFPVQSFDKKRIHSIYFAQESWTKSQTKRPIILWVHDGPDDHIDHSYFTWIQQWAQRGFIVLTPNTRGSTGYGKTFERLNDRDWGGGHVQDLLAIKREFSKLPFVDSKRIFIAGTGYGGFSTLTALAQFPSEFRAAMCINPIVNLISFMNSLPPDPAWQEEYLTEVGDPKSGEASLKNRSPFFAANKIKTPIMMFQAEGDQRTSKAEMDAFVEELNRGKVQVKYVILKNEGHQIQRAESQATIQSGTADFFESFK